MWNLRPEQISSSVPRLRSGIESDRIKGDLEEVDRLSVVLRQVPDKFVLIWTRQVENVVIKNVLTLKKLFFLRSTKYKQQY